MSENQHPKVESTPTADLHPWRQKINQHLVIILAIAIFLAVIITSIILGYSFDWTDLT